MSDEEFTLFKNNGYFTCITSDKDGLHEDSENLINLTIINEGTLEKESIVYGSNKSSDKE